VHQAQHCQLGKGSGVLSAEELSGGLMVATAPHRGWRAALRSALCDSGMARGNDMELCQARGSWGVGDRVCT